MAFLYSTVLDDAPAFERVESFHGGMDGFNRPTLLAQNQCADLKNCVLADNGTVKLRPGADEIGGANKPADTSETSIQGVAYYDTSSVEQLMCFVNGVPHYYDGSWTKPAGFTADTGAMIEMAQGNDTLYINDTASNWQSWNGTAFTDLADGASSPPKGASGMCWHAGRMFAFQNDYLYYSDLGDAGNGKWDRTNRYLIPGRGEGQKIIALASLPSFWLAIFKEQSIFIANTNPTDSTLAYSMIQFVGSGPGCVGKRAVAVSGGDCYFMARDGVRSLRRLTTAEDQFEIAPPLSQPVQPYIDRINWSVANTICAVAYRHYVLFAVPLDSATTPDYVLVYNIRLGSWCGYWTGWNPRCFAVSRFSNVQKLEIGDTSGRVNRWKDTDSESLQATFQDNGTDIPILVKSRSFLFGEPVSNKDGFYAEVRFVNTSTGVTVGIYNDDVMVKELDSNLDETINQLPVDLPFDLATAGPKTVRVPMNLLGDFNECYLQVESTAGKVEVKNMTVAAFLNTIENE